MESKVREYPKGSIVFRRGEPGNTAFILTEGSVEISVTEGKNKTVLGVLKPVAVFGEMALLLKNQQRTATAITLTDAKLAEISRKNFDDFFNQAPKLISAVLRTMVERLEQTNSRVTQNPEVYTIITETLELLIRHEQYKRIRYSQLIDCIVNSYKLEPAIITKSLNFMVTLGLIEISTDSHSNQKYIDVIKPTDFIDRARQIQKTYAKIGGSPDSAIG